MLIDYSILFIVALMPIVSLILVVQKNPYHALVIRAILGAVATLVYAVLGAPDVALTEAMVGTLLAVALYIIAVRSSQVMRLGILGGMETNGVNDHQEAGFNSVLAGIKEVIDRYYLRLELIEYPDLRALKQAMTANEIHGMCVYSNRLAVPGQKYMIALRVSRLFEIFSQESQVPKVYLTFAGSEDQKH